MPWDGKSLIATKKSPKVAYQKLKVKSLVKKKEEKEKEIKVDAADYNLWKLARSIALDSFIRKQKRNKNK